MTDAVLSVALEKVAERVLVGDGCWLWVGARNARDYGKIAINGEWWYAHRLVYELLVGPIPAGLVIDHLCRVLTCVRPDHLEPVTQAENLRRGYAAAPWGATKRWTHCKHGHALTAENTATYFTARESGKRCCRLCKNAAARERYHARKRNPAIPNRGGV